MMAVSVVLVGFPPAVSGRFGAIPGKTTADSIIDVADRADRRRSRNDGRPERRDRDEQKRNNARWRWRTVGSSSPR
jgi:hypothetical protein